MQALFGVSLLSLHDASSALFFCVLFALFIDDGVATGRNSIARELNVQLVHHGLFE